MQSPVNIETHLVHQDPQLLERPLKWNYDPKNSETLLNTGAGWKVLVEGQDYLTGGPLQHSYKLFQFHCHWSKCNDYGSEHTVDGRSHTAELHLVHWNTDMYKSMEEAVASPKGVAAIAIFFDVGKHHEELARITDLLQEVACKGEKVLLPQGVDPAIFFPEQHDYWTYEGSFTTYPFHETVTWIVFKTPIEVSEEQLQKFRCLLSVSTRLESDEKDVKTLETFRPVEPLNGRVIREAPY